MSKFSIRRSDSGRAGGGVIWCNQICKSECPAWDMLMEWLDEAKSEATQNIFKFSMRRSNSGSGVRCSHIWSPHKMSNCPALEGPILVCVWGEGVIRCSQIWSPHWKVRLWGYLGIWCSQNWSPHKMSKFSKRRPDWGRGAEGWFDVVNSEVHKNFQVVGGGEIREVDIWWAVGEVNCNFWLHFPPSVSAWHHR